MVSLMLHMSFLSVKWVVVSCQLKEKMQATDSQAKKQIIV